MSGTTTTTQVSPMVLQSWAHKILPTPESDLEFNIAASGERMPANGGTTWITRRYANLAPALVPLGNTGQTPPAQQLSVTDIQATIEFYGTYTYVNEQVILQNQESVLAQTFLRLSYNAALTEDTLLRDLLASTAAFVNCVGGVNGDNPTEMAESDVNDMEVSLLGQNGRKFTSMLMGSDRYGSSPIPAAYLMLSHTNVCNNFYQMQNYVRLSRYSEKSTLSVCENGSIGAFRMFVSSNGSYSSNASNNGATVFNNICCAWDAFGNIKMDQYNLKAVYLGPEFSGPLALNASIGWKSAMAFVIKNDAWVNNLRSTQPA